MKAIYRKKHGHHRLLFLCWQNSTMAQHQTITHTIIQYHPQHGLLCARAPPPSTSRKKKSLDDPQISLKCCTPNPFPKNSPPISWRWHAIIPWQQSPMMGRFVQVSIWEFDPIYLPQRLELLHTSVRHDDVGGCIVGVENNVNMQLVCKHASKYRKYIAFTIYVIYNIHN